MRRTSLAVGALCLLLGGCGGNLESQDAGKDARRDALVDARDTNGSSDAGANDGGDAGAADAGAADAPVPVDASAEDVRDANDTSDAPVPIDADAGANGATDVPISGDADAGAADGDAAWDGSDAGDGPAVEAAPSLWPSEIPVMQGPKPPLSAGDPVCYPSGWCWENPLPIGGNLAVWALAADDVWAVGSHGIARHFDGQRWANVPTPTTVRLDDVWGTATDAVWAVGNGVLLHWNGASWALVDTGGRGGESLTGLGPKELWLAGTVSGLIHHYDGEYWDDSLLVSPTYDIHETPDGTVFAAVESLYADGDLRETSPSIPGGTRTVRSNIGTQVRGVWGTGLTDVWLVKQTYVLRYDDKTWRTSLMLPDVPGSPYFRRVHGSDASNVWVSARDGSMLRWNGASYERWTSGVSLPDRVCARAANDVWTAGWSGALSHFDGTAWQRHGSGPQMLQLHTLGPVGDEVWAVGNDPTGPKLLRGAPGGPWQEIPTSLPPLSAAALWGASPNDVWVVGQGYGPEYPSYIHHWDGSRWTSVAGLPMGGYLSVWGTSSDDVWAVGPDLRHWNGMAWQVVTFQTDLPIKTWRTVTGSGKNDVWLTAYTAATGALRIYQWNGADWNNLPAALTGASLTVRGPKDAYVGDGGLLQHFDGQQWKTLYTDPNARQGELALRGSEIWRNQLGTLSSWNGSTWVPSDQLETECWRIFGTATDVWVGCTLTSSVGVGIMRLKR